MSSSLSDLEKKLSDLHAKRNYCDRRILAYTEQERRKSRQSREFDTTIGSLTKLKRELQESIDKAQKIYNREQSDAHQKHDGGQHQTPKKPGVKAILRRGIFFKPVGV